MTGKFSRLADHPCVFGTTLGPPPGYRQNFKPLIKCEGDAKKLNCLIRWAAEPDHSLIVMAGFGPTTAFGMAAYRVKRPAVSERGIGDGGSHISQARRIGSVRLFHLEHRSAHISEILLLQRIEDRSMCGTKPDHFEVMFDPIAKTAILLSGGRYAFLSGPFKDYEDACRAAKAADASDIRREAYNDPKVD